jgi:IS30 family transposase
VSIHQRPATIDDRSEFGHWEGDSVEGIRSVGDGIHTEVERVSRMIIARKVGAISSAEGIRAQRTIFEPLPPGARKSVTMDNGKEMHNHYELVTSLGMDTYFADPYSSWQRGTNEHHNGRIRRYFPKGSDFSTVTEQELHEAITEINNQPRKCLAWYTPAEVFAQQLELVETNECCASK